MLKRISGLETKLLTFGKKEIPSPDGPLTIKIQLWNYCQGVTGSTDPRMPGGEAQKFTKEERMLAWLAGEEIAKGNGEVCLKQEQYDIVKRLCDQDQPLSVVITEPVRIAVNSAENVEDLAAIK